MKQKKDLWRDFSPLFTGTMLSTGCSKDIVWEGLSFLVRVCSWAGSWSMGRFPSPLHGLHSSFLSTGSGSFVAEGLSAEIHHGEELSPAPSEVDFWQVTEGRGNSTRAAARWVLWHQWAMAMPSSSRPASPPWRHNSSWVLYLTYRPKCCSFLTTTNTVFWIFLLLSASNNYNPIIVNNSVL